MQKQQDLEVRNLAAELGEEDSLRDKALRLCRENKLAVFSLLVILLIALAAIFAPAVAPYDPNKQDLLNRMQGMSLAHPFGTDQLGRDVLSRMIYGARVSLCIGLFPTMISMLLGTISTVPTSWLPPLVARLLLNVLPDALSTP